MLARHIALQLVDLRMEHQVNRFMGCDYNIELFFRFFKHVLNCRHLLSHHTNGITIQVYMAIIACLLITLWTGRKATRRTYEILCHAFAGWATEAEVEAHIAKLQRLDGGVQERGP